MKLCAASLNNIALHERKNDEFIKHGNVYLTYTQSCNASAGSRRLEHRQLRKLVVR